MHPAIPRTAAFSKTGVQPAPDAIEAFAPAPVAARGPVLVRIGDIAVTPQWVHTPVGSVPLAETRWEYRDGTHTYHRTPGWALLLALVTFPFGLPLLLVKQNVTWGRVQVVVSAPGFEYAPMHRIHSQRHAEDLAARVNYAWGLTRPAGRSR